MKLFQDEIVIKQADNKNYLFTNVRIRQMYGNNATSILLENILCIKMRYRENALLLYLGIFILVGALIATLSGKDFIGAAVGLGVLGIVFILLYYNSRTHYLFISSGAGDITLSIQGQGTEKISEFIDQIEEAICNRKRAILHSKAD